MSERSLFGKITQIINDKLHPEHDIDLMDNLFENLDADEVDFVAIMATIKQTIGVDFSDEEESEVRKDASVYEILNLVNKKMEG
jgi:acyl carrier protein